MNVFVRNHNPRLAVEKAGQFPPSRNDDTGNTSGVMVEFKICYPADLLAISDIYHILAL
jgi:hypothetical protein